MQIQLSQKERMFLEDGKLQEEVCIEKYKNYSQQAEGAELKQLFNKLAGEEQHHYDIINSYFAECYSLRRNIYFNLNFGIIATYM